jgi:hypothetical protein
MLTAQQDRFVEAVNRLAGAVITKEVAAALIYAATVPPDESIDPATFDLEQHGEYVLRAERFATLVAALHPLHEAQWQETEGHRHGLPFSPDYEAGLRFEKAGALVQFTIRRDGELVGHMRMYLQSSVHTRTRFAHEDTIYIVPQHRTGMLGVAMVRYVERQLRKLDVREIRFDTKHSNRADAILRRCGHAPVATRWVKVFKEHDHVR